MQTEKMPFGFGAFPSPEDYRDIPLSVVLGDPKDLPKMFFVDIDNLPIWNQKAIGSCTGQAGAKYKQKKEEIETGGIINFSPRFLYGLAKCKDGYAFEGTWPRLIMQIKQEYGCATEATVPNNCDLSHEEYVFQRKESNIPQEAFSEAKRYAIKSYAFVNVRDPIFLKQAVVQADGCMLLMRLGREWWADKKGNGSYSAKDILPLRAPASIVSGHEVYLYGYLDVTPQEADAYRAGRVNSQFLINKYLKNNTDTGERTETLFFILNSWSKGWANNGRGDFFYSDQKDFINEALTEIDLPNDWLEKVKELPAKKDFRHEFKTDIVRYQKSEEVVALQTALMIDGEFDKELFGRLLKNDELGYYGSITQKAVDQFARKYKVANAWELRIVSGKRVGAKTRAKLNSLFNN